jgi:hypothetical protein
LRSQSKRRSRRNNPFTPVNGASSGNQAKDTRCEVCLGPMGKGKKICSPRCRLVKWGAKTLLEAWNAGQANGLRDLIMKLRPPRFIVIKPSGPGSPENRGKRQWLKKG